MPLAPLAQFTSVLGSMTARDFSARHATEDVVLVEPYEKGRDYHGPLHADVLYMFMPKAVGEPVPVGRDERATVQIDHAAVSRLHVVLAWSGRTWQTMDRSSNGSWMDEQRLPREEAVDLAYGKPVRLGRAVIVRVHTPAELYARMTQAGQTRTVSRPQPSVPASDPGSSTWRFPNVARESGRLAQGQFPEPAAAPAPSPPRPPVAPSGPPPSDDIEIEFDLDLGSDERGGFA